MKVRPARLRDCLALRALHRQALEERSFVRTVDELPSIEAFEADVDRYQRSENSCWWVAVQPQSHLVGALKLTGGALVRTRHAAHFTVMVDRAFRRQGIGSALLDEALAWARSHPMLKRVGLSVFADNDAAIALYRSRGFVEEGRMLGAYREPDGQIRDDLRMGLSIE